MKFEDFRKIPRLNRDIVVTEKIDGTNACVLILNMTALLPEGVEAGDLSDRLTTVTGLDGSLFAVWAGKRTSWVNPSSGGKNWDNYGFGQWVLSNAAELVALLGPGRHFGEWWGAGIQRRYGLANKRFSLFNIGRYGAAPEVRDPRCYAPTIGGQELYEPKHKIHNGVKMCACRPAQGDVRTTIGGVEIAPVPVLWRGPWFGSLVVGGEPRHGYAPALALQLLAEEGSVAAPGFMDPEGIVVFHEASGQLFKATVKGDEKPKGAQ